VSGTNYEIVYPERNYVGTWMGKFKVTADGRVVGEFADSDDAYTFMAVKQDPAEFGQRAARKDYWDDVRNMAESIKDELMDRIKEGEEGEPVV